MKIDAASHDGSTGEWFSELLTAAAGTRPPDEVRLRLRARVLDAARDGTEVLRAGEGAWQPMLPGIEVRCLRRDVERDSQTCLWRLAAGATIPAHGHQRDEECLVLEGEIHQHGEVYGPGDYLLARAGTRQFPIVAPGGAVLLIRGEIHG